MKIKPKKLQNNQFVLKEMGPLTISKETSIKQTVIDFYWLSKSKLGTKSLLTQNGKKSVTNLQEFNSSSIVAIFDTFTNNLETSGANGVHN